MADRETFPRDAPAARTARRLLSHFREPLVEHGKTDALDAIAFALGGGVRSAVVWRDPRHRRILRRARFAEQEGFLAALGDRAEVGIRPPGPGRLPIGEAVLDFGFHRRDVDIADDHQSGPLGPVIGVIEIRDFAHRALRMTSTCQGERSGASWPFSRNLLAASNAPCPVVAGALESTGPRSALNLA